MDCIGPDFVILHSRNKREIKTVDLWIFSDPTATTGELIATVLGDFTAKAEATKTAVAAVTGNGVTVGDKEQEQGRGHTTRTAQTIIPLVLGIFSVFFTISRCEPH